MPLDPILANPAKLDIGDPLRDAVNFLQASQYKSAADKARREEQTQNALLGLYRDNTDANGVTNWNAMRAGAARLGVGSAIPGMLEEEGKRALNSENINLKKAETGFKQAETLETGAKTAKTEQEAFKEAFANYRERLNGLSSDPAVGLTQLVEWKKGMFADPVMGPILLKQGDTPEKAEQRTREAFKTDPNLLLRLSAGNAAASEQDVTTVNAGDRQITRYTPKHTLTPQAPIVDKMGHDPDAHLKGTHVNVTNTNYVAGKGNEAYTEQYNKGLAERDLGKMDAAEAAPDLISRADRIDQSIKTGRVFTGTGAPIALGVEKAKAVFGLGDKEKIANTELLGSDLAKMTLEHIKSSGLAGSNGLTEGERGFLERAVAGQITWDDTSLRQMAQIARKQGEATIQRYKPRHDHVQHTGIQGAAFPPNTPTAPPAPSQYPTPPKANIDRLRAHPEERAIFEKHYGPGSAKRYAGI